MAEAKIIMSGFEAIKDGLKAVAEATAERHRESEARISDLEEKVKRLQDGERMSLAQRLRARGIS